MMDGKNFANSSNWFLSEKVTYFSGIPISVCNDRVLVFKSTSRSEMCAFSITKIVLIPFLRVMPTGSSSLQMICAVILRREAEF